MSGGNYTLYPASVVLPLLSGIAFIIDMPPLVWHIRNRNIGAAGLIFWLQTHALFNFINPLIWPRDNIFEWWDGRGLCDVEVRVIIASYLGVLSSVTPIVTGLAKVLDTDRGIVSKSANQIRRQYALDSIFTFGLPVIFIVLYHVVQTQRYFIIGITGCSPAISESWVSVVLILVWPLVFAVVNAYFAGLVVYRLHRYRRNFSSMLSSSGTTQSRFWRLFAISVIIVLASIAVSAPGVKFAVRFGPGSYSWHEVHRDWMIVRVPSFGQVDWKQWVFVVCSYLVFMFFGVGKEARDMYHGWLKKAGLAKFFPALESSEKAQTLSGKRMFSSATSKVKSLFSIGTSTNLKSNSFLDTISTTKSKATRKSSYRLSGLSFTTKRQSNTQQELPVRENSADFGENGSAGTMPNVSAAHLSPEMRSSSS